MKKFFLSLLLVFMAAGSSVAQGYPFTPIDTAFASTNYLLLPPGFQFSIVFQQGQPVVLSNGTTKPSRGVNDFMVSHGTF